MSRYKYPRTIYKWPLQHLVWIWEVGCEFRSDEEMGLKRSFPNAERLFARVNKKYGSIARDYLAKTNSPLTPAVLYDRLHKNYYGDLDSKGRSPEHPLRHSEKRKLTNAQKELPLEKPKKVLHHEFLMWNGTDEYQGFEDEEELVMWLEDKVEISDYDVFRVTGNTVIPINIQTKIVLEDK